MTDPLIVIAAGTLVTCENGHEIARVAEPGLQMDQFVRAKDFDWIGEPLSAGAVAVCPACGLPFYSIGRIHTAEGWRP